MTPKELFTAEELAENLRIHPHTVRRLARAGKLPGFKIGRQWRFEQKQMDELKQRKSISLRDNFGRIIMTKSIYSFILLNVLLFQCSARAAETSVVPPEASAPEERSVKENPTLKDFGVLVGYGTTKAKNKDDYVSIPIYFRFGIDCDKFGLGFSDWIERGARDFFHKDYRPKSTTEFFIEPFVSYVPSPDSNMEGGIIVAFKYEMPLTEKFHPYLWGGGGGMYITEHLHEQSTQWSFTPQFGGGFSYFLNKNKALNVEYRYRHFSNANLKLPNDGINQGFISVGLTWYY